MDHCSVYVTCPDEATAERIALHLVNERLVACANILPGATSVYRWEGRVQRDREVVMLMKTRRSLFRDVEAAVRELHPAKVPCVVAFDLAGGHAAYLDWIDQETARPASRS